MTYYEEHREEILAQHRTEEYHINGTLEEHKKVVHFLEKLT